MKRLTKIRNATPRKPVEIAYVADPEEGTHISSQMKERYPRTYKFSRMICACAYDVRKVKQVAIALRKHFAVKAKVKEFYENNLGDDGSYRIMDRFDSSGQMISEGVPLPAKLEKIRSDAWIELTSFFVVGELHFFTDQETWVPEAGEEVELHLRNADPLKDDGATYRITRVLPLEVEEAEDDDPLALAKKVDDEVSEVSDFITELASV